MKISKDMIKKKKFVGTTGKGMPILLVETHGGLYACFAQNDRGEIETLSAAPHKAIALFLAEKKDKNLKWREELDELVKSREKELTQNLKQKMFAPSVLTKSETDCYLVYDFDEDSVIITKAEDLLELYNNNEIKKSSLIRKSDLSDEPIFASDFDFIELQKGAKELKAMYGSSITPEQENFVSWATSKLPNGNWQEWAVKNHAKNPKQFTIKAVKNIEHFAGSKHIPNIAKVRFDKHDIKQGLEAFKAAEDQYNTKALASPQIIKPSKQTTKFMDVGDNYAWYMLNKPACKAEGAAMGHCGNVPSKKKGQNVLSLRKEVKIGNKTYHEPVATFILQPDGKTIGEMKGRANLIPQPKYHKYIKQLFERSDLLPEGGGYLPGNNFHLNDLSHEEHDDLLTKRPELAKYSNRLNPEQQIQLAKNPKNHQNLAENPNLHPELQKQLAQSKDEYTLQRLAGNPNLHPELQKQLAQSQDKYTLRRLAKNPNLHPEAQNQLAQRKDVYTLIHLAENHNLHPELQNQLAQSKDINTLQILAGNPNLHPEAQNQLAQIQDEYTLQRLAENPNLHPELQKQLAQSTDVDTLYPLTRNPNLHPEAQNQLAQSQDKYTLRRLAKNPNLHPEAQKQLAQSTDVDTLQILAGNPNLHPEAQNQLAQSTDVDTLQNLARNPNLQPEAQNQLAQSKDKDTLRYLAINPNLHPEAQNQLAQSKNESVLEYLSENTNIHPEVQAKLLEIDDPLIHEHIIFNSNVHPEIQKKALKRLKESDPELAEEINNRLKLKRLKEESDKNLAAREARVKDYFERFNR